MLHFGLQVLQDPHLLLQLPHLGLAHLSQPHLGLQVLHLLSHLLQADLQVLWHLSLHEPHFSLQPAQALPAPAKQPSARSTKAAANIFRITHPSQGLVESKDYTLYM
ncbi:hypothetical protein IT575_12525 [bacterium]|nr:hypothetical protein [bacterium]